MKLRESLFSKLLASILFILTLAASVCGGAYVSYVSYNGDVWSSREILTRTRPFQDKMNQDASAVQEYYSLLQASKSAETPLSYESAHQMAQYEQQLGLSGGGNFVFQLLDGEGNVLLSNLQDGETDVSALAGANGAYRLPLSYSLSVSSEPSLLVYGLREGLPAADEYADLMARRINMQDSVMPVLIATIVCGLLCALLFCFLVAAAGHRPGGETAVLNPFDHIWLEVPVAALLLLSFLWVMALYSKDLVLFCISAVLAGGMLLATVLSVVRRIKAGKVYQTTFLHLLVKFFVTVMQHVHVVVRVAGAFVLYAAAQLVLVLAMSQGTGLAWFIWIMGNLSLIVLIVIVAIQYDKVKQGTEKMAEGNLGVVINEKEVPFFGQMAHNLNSSGSAIKIAVEHATQSERMKSELITNVSHDIKTPLTSIINYVDLLKTTGITDPKALEYVDVLERKSKRLAQLMADLVEASKVTSGAVGVHMESLNLGELVKQAGGEFEERFAERGIQLMCRLPDQPVLVYADGRHMWRVLDNLFGNAVKYALDNTRIYVDLADLGNEVVLSMKNISRDPLNIHPDELMERFTRGDSARVGEGSGLGLSIARSLMELQNGTLDLQIDGDLFKVVLALKKM